MKIMRILSPSPIIWESDDLRPIQSLGTNSKNAFQVAKLSFRSQKMRIVPKFMQNQFSDFKIFSLKKIYILRYWDKDFSTKNSDDKFSLAPILMNILLDTFQKTLKKTKNSTNCFRKLYFFRIFLILRIFFLFYLFFIFLIIYKGPSNSKLCLSHPE